MRANISLAVPWIVTVQLRHILMLSSVNHQVVLNTNACTLVLNAPERNVLLLTEWFHAAGRLESAHHKVHWHEHADLEAVDELTSAKGVAIAYAAIYRKHHQVEIAGNLTYVLEFS